jgi:patatin-related protein
MQRSREVRLGAVLYGGVSLAIYENGVAQEFYRAVKGEGIYSLIKFLTDSDIVVDVVSGTSAGGINGILLSYALVNRRNFADAARLWREDGDILRLLRSPSDPSTLSVLDSEGYYQPRLEAAFREMSPYDETRRDSQYESDIGELDLFITGTDVDGRVYTVLDDQAHPIDVKDHRAIFQLCYREGRKNEFDVERNASQAIAALAKLARITSCFPVAFAPVTVTAPDDYTDPDWLLQRWGNLGRKACFLDGGVLDNKPFSYTLDAIFGRLADREIERLLFYVEPDPERLQHPGRVSQPNVVEAAVAAMVSIPGYESIGKDLARIKERNDRIACYQELRDSLRADGTVPAWVEETPQAAFTRLYKQDAGRSRLYRKCRLVQVRDRAVLGILKKHGRLEALNDDEKRHAQLLVESFRDWPGYELDTLIDFDVYYRLRRLYYLVYRIHEWLYEKDAGVRRDLYQELWRKLNHQIKLLEILRYFMEKLIDDVDFDWKLVETENDTTAATRLWARAHRFLSALLDSNAIDLPDISAVQPDSPDPIIYWRQSREQFAEAVRARAEWLSKRPEPPAAAGESLLRSLDRIESILLRTFEQVSPGNVVSGEYCDFLITDSYLFPMECAGGLEAKDPIHTVRISPQDANLGICQRPLDAKICGNEFAHFGGFFKRSWRSNDILWGRLDGLTEVLKCLLDKKRLRDVWMGRQLFLPSELEWHKLFPNASEEQLDALAADLGRLPELVDHPDEFHDFVERLAIAAQMEIVREQVPTVIADGVAQQVDWNQYRMSAERRSALTAGPPIESVDASDQSWRTGNAVIDPLLATVAAEQLANTALKESADSDWAVFFKDKFAVGSEKFPDDIPKPVLMEIFSAAALLLENCLVGAFGARAAQVKSAGIYKYGLHYPLLFGYHYSRLQRRAPDFARVMTPAVAAVALTVLTIGCLAWKSLVMPDGQLSAVALLEVIVAPLAVLAGLYTLTLRYHPNWPGQRNTATMALKWLFASAVVFVLVAELALLAAAHLARITVPNALTLSHIPRLPWIGGLLSKLFQPDLSFVAGVVVTMIAMMLLWSIGLVRPRKVSKRALRTVLRGYFAMPELLRLATTLGTETGVTLLDAQQRSRILKIVRAAVTASALEVIPRLDLDRLGRKCGETTAAGIAARLPDVQLTDLELLRVAEVLRVPSYPGVSFCEDERKALVRQIVSQASIPDLLANIRQMRPGVLDSI